MAAATSYTNSYPGLGSQGDLYHSANYGSYDTGFGSLTSHPYQYQTSKYSYLSDHPQQSSHATDPYGGPSLTNPSRDNYGVESNDQLDEFSNQNTNSRGNFKSNGAVPATTKTHEQQNNDPNNNHQNPSKGPQVHHHVPSDDPMSKPTSKSTGMRREASLKSQPLPPIGQHPPSSNENHGHGSSGTTGKGSNPAVDLRMTKSQTMRAAAIKQKEEVLEQKRRDAYFPSNGNGKKSSTTNKKSPPKNKDDGNQSDRGKVRRSKKQSHSVPKQRRSRRMNYLTDESSSSSDEDQASRSKSRKRANDDKYPLPPLRRGRPPPPPHPYYDPVYDYPPAHPMRRRHPPYYDELYPYPYPYPYPPYRQDYRTPPYLPSYQDPYDGFFDYEKRKNKPKSKSRGEMTANETEREDDPPSKFDHHKRSKSKAKKSNSKEDPGTDHEETKRLQRPVLSNYYEDGDALETWRQERNDYLKKKFKPTIHEVLYSQQWMKADSYVENQRRRALRDTQGYYFPYKQYTLKDYKDLQRSEANKNPYAPMQDPLTDRKERTKKPPTDGSHRSNKSLAPLKPMHPDPEKFSKRERALEYAKVQVLRHPAQKGSKNRVDPTEEYVNNLFPAQDDEGEGEEEEENDYGHAQRRKNAPVPSHHRQSEGDDDENQ